MGFDLDRTRLAKGVISVSWNILEEGDGGVVQLVYAGDVGTQIRCRGVIEGQRGVRELKIPQDYIQSPESQLRSLRQTRYIFLVIGLLILITGPMSLLALHTEVAISHGWRRLVRLLIYVGVPILMSGACLYFFASGAVPAPPFGF